MNAWARRGGHHDGVRKAVILGRGGAGKSALSRQLSDVTGIPTIELDALFWQPGPTPMDPWAIGSEAPHAKLYVLRNPAVVRRFADEVRQTAAQERRSE